MKYNFNFWDKGNEEFEEESEKEFEKEFERKFKKGSEKEFEELKEMIKYQERTKKELKKIKTYSDFSYAVTQELKAQGIDIGTLEKILYDERNIIFELFNRFEEGELKNWDLSELNEELFEIIDKSEFVDKINRTYSYLTGKSSDFYRQYEKFAEKTIKCLNFEIIYRKMDGDYK